jgi:transposase, IS5 family
MQTVKDAPNLHRHRRSGLARCRLPGVEIIHRGRIKRLTAKARRVLKRREAVAPVIGPLKDDCGLPRNWQKGSEGDVRHPVHCAASDNLRWLMRVFACLGLKAH